jgi:hypothetical protein
MLSLFWLLELIIRLSYRFGEARLDHNLIHLSNASSYSSIIDHHWSFSIEASLSSHDLLPHEVLADLIV